MTFPTPCSRRRSRTCYRRDHNPENLDFEGPSARSKPTLAVPCSEDKMRVLMDRFEHGEDLFNQDDPALPDRLGFTPGPRTEDQTQGGRGELVAAADGEESPDQPVRPTRKPWRTPEQMEQKNASRRTQEGRAQSRAYKRRWRARKKAERKTEESARTCRTVTVCRGGSSRE